MQLFHKRLVNDKNTKYSSRHNKIGLNAHNLSPLRYRQSYQIRDNNNIFDKNYQTTRNNYEHRKKSRPESKYSETAFNEHRNISKITCMTHTEKQAEFGYISDNQAFFYCCLCAAKLASQGFQMQKVSQIYSHSKQGNNCQNYKQNKELLNHQYNNRNVTHEQTQIRNSCKQKINKKSKIRCKKYSTNSLIQQLNNLSYSIDQLLLKYQSLAEQQHIEQQKQLICKFYEKIIDIVTTYKLRHLQKLQQFTSSTQSIQKITSNIRDLSIIKKDMTQTDFDEVIQKVSIDDFKVCLQFYVTKFAQFQEEYKQISSKISSHSQDVLRKSQKHPVSVIQQNIDKIQNILKNFYEPQNSRKISQKPLHNLLKQYQKNDKPKLQTKNLFQNQNYDYRNSPQYKLS